MAEPCSKVVVCGIVSRANDGGTAKYLGDVISCTVTGVDSSLD